MIGKLCLLIISYTLMILYVLIREKSKKKANFFLIIWVVVMSLAFAFREYIFDGFLGTDYNNYKDWFENIRLNIRQIEYKNMGFNILVLFIRYIYNDFHFFLFVCGVIINSCIISFIIHNSDDIILSSAIYIGFFYLSTFNTLRQWIACAIFLGAFKYIEEKKLINYIVNIFIASLFHDTAITLLLLYPVLNSKIKLIKKEIIFMIIGFIMFFGYKQIVVPMLQVTETIGFDYLDKYSSKSSSYETGNLTAVIITLLIYISLKIEQHIKKNLDVKIDKILVFLLVALIFNLLGTKNLFFNRMSIYFWVSIIIAAPIAVKMFNKEDRKIINGAICSLLAIAFLK